MRNSTTVQVMETRISWDTPTIKASLQGVLAHVPMTNCVREQSTAVSVVCNRQFQLTGKAELTGRVHNVPCNCVFG
jgi:hypothetical protein